MAARQRKPRPKAGPKGLTPEDLRKARETRKGLEPVAVPAPELGNGKVQYVRALTGDERDELDVRQTREAEAEKAAGRSAEDSAIGLRARMLAAHGCDEEGTRLYTYEDAAWLGELPSGFLDRVFDRCIALSRISAEDVKALEGN